MNNKKKIGLTFGDLSDISNHIKKKFPKNRSVNSGDFEVAFVSIINATLEKCNEKMEVTTLEEAFPLYNKAEKVVTESNPNVNPIKRANLICRFLEFHHGSDKADEILSIVFENEVL